MQQIGAMLGHRSMQSTLVYAHLNNQATREAREAGQLKMKQMMLDARKRQKALSGKKDSTMKLAVKKDPKVWDKQRKVIIAMIPTYKKPEPSK